MVEKRKNKRIKYAGPVYVSGMNSDEVSLAAYDLSMTGMGVLIPTPKDVGDMLDVRFHVNSGDNLREISLTGEIRHCCLKGDVYVTGLQFF